MDLQHIINCLLALHLNIDKKNEASFEIENILKMLFQYKKEQALQLQQGGVRRSIYEYFTDEEIGLFAHLVKEYSKAGGHSEYKQGKLDKLEAKLKQLRSF